MQLTPVLGDIILMGSEMEATSASVALLTLTLHLTQCFLCCSLNLRPHSKLNWPPKKGAVVVISYQITSTFCSSLLLHFIFFYFSSNYLFFFLLFYFVLRCVFFLRINEYKQLYSQINNTSWCRWPILKRMRKQIVRDVVGTKAETTMIEARMGEENLNMSCKEIVTRKVRRTGRKTRK